MSNRWRECRKKGWGWRQGGREGRVGMERREWGKEGGRKENREKGEGWVGREGRTDGEGRVGVAKRLREKGIREAEGG